jgi:ketosteroid isomerase-like protein
MPASLELVKIALQAYGCGDCEIALALAAPLIRWDERASRPDGDLVWGHDKVQRAMRRYLDSWEEYSFDLEDIAEVGTGKVVGICRERGKPKDGSAVDRRFGGLWLVDEGKIVSWTTYLTPREAVRSAKELLGGRIEQQQVKRTSLAAKPAESFRAPSPAPAPEVAEEPVEVSPAERPRKKVLTKSEEQKRAARARAQLRTRASRQTASGCAFAPSASAASCAVSVGLLPTRIP